jgi:integrase
VSSSAATPRRRRVPGKDNTGVYERPDGLYEIGFQDADGRPRWRGPFDGILAARKARAVEVAKAARGHRIARDPRMPFAAAAELWWEAHATSKREATRDVYRRHLDTHLLPAFGKRRLTEIDVDAVARYVSRKLAAGAAAWSVKGHLTVLSSIFRYASRRLGFEGTNPVSMLERDERPSPSDAPDRRVYTRDELDQTLAATTEPWQTLFRLADIVGGRESELLALWWENLALDHLDAATIRFTHQVDRGGARVPLKTEESKATLPLPRAAALMLLEHKARSIHTGGRSFVFATRTGKAISQRDVLRALYRAQRRARDAEGRPTFPELFEHDRRGQLVVDGAGAYVPRRVKRRELDLPDFHALRHGAAMACEDAEEARDLLRHKNSNVTRAIYRAHFDDRRREALRARMESRMENGSGRTPQQPPDRYPSEVVDMQDIRRTTQQTATP